MSRRGHNSSDDINIKVATNSSVHQSKLFHKTSFTLNPIQSKRLFFVHDVFHEYFVYSSESSHQLRSFLFPLLNTFNYESNRLPCKFS